MEQNHLDNIIDAGKLAGAKLAAIKNMTDQQLLASTDKVVSEERRITLEVLLHLREVEIRRLFVDLKCESMHKYCTKHLKYSESAAQCRLSSARLLRELPEIEAQIQNGDLNVTNLSAVQSFVRAEKMAAMPLTREEKLELISSIENKSTRKVKAELIKHSHQPALLADKFQMSVTANSLAEPRAGFQLESQPEFQLTKFEASMTGENLELLQEFRNLYAHDLPDLSNHSILMFLIEKAVQHKKKTLGLIEKKSNAAPPPANDVLDIQDSRRPLSVTIRRQVWKRANACCEHVDAKIKTRCSSKFALETDHIVAVALGGSNELDNLRLLCRAHNSRRAIKTFGPWLKR